MQDSEAVAFDRCIRHAKEEDGRRIAMVPLGPRGDKGLAVIEDADLEMLFDLGLSMRWNRHSKTGAVFAPAPRASGSNVQVARVLMDCGPGENVSYRNGDPTDLRRENLVVNPEGYATRRDRDFLTPRSERKQWGPEVEHVNV